MPSLLILFCYLLTPKHYSVLGCHMVGEDAPEIMQGLAIAIKCQGNEGSRRKLYSNYFF